MKNQFQISIPNPCHQNWQEMTVAENGRFCNSCQKTVIDFTRQSDAIIIKSFDENTNLCGRFLPNQLDRMLSERQEKSIFWQVGLASFLGFLGLGSQTSFAQSKVKVENNKNNLSIKEVALDVIEEFELKGIVFDSINPSLPGAVIKNLNSNNSIQTDFEGKFTIKTKIKDTILITYVGCENMTYVVNQKHSTLQNYKLINLKILYGTVGGAFMYHKPSFFRKITRPFRNLFKKKKCTTSSPK